MRKLDADECDKCGRGFEEDEVRFREGVIYKPYHPVHGWITKGSMQVYTGRVLCEQCAGTKQADVRRKRASAL